jgi:uncharacterized protein YutE (UPF0331/DUF86 family)
LELKFDEDRIRKLSSELTSALKALKDLGSLSKEEFISDIHKIGSAKYNFIVVIEAAIDMCNHLINRNSFRTPEDYADTFRVMEEVGMFEVDFTKTLINMAKFRNRLVHIYWEVDNDELYRILTEDVRDVDRFMSDYGKFIEERIVDNAI